MKVDPVRHSSQSTRPAWAGHLWNVRAVGSAAHGLSHKVPWDPPKAGTWISIIPILQTQRRKYRLPTIFPEITPLRSSKGGFNLDILVPESPFEPPCYSVSQKYFFVSIKVPVVGWTELFSQERLIEIRTPGICLFSFGWTTPHTRV